MSVLRGFLHAWLLAFFLATSVGAADNIGLYMELLAYHSSEKALLERFRIKAYPVVEREVIERLAPAQLNAHLRKYLGVYQQYKNRLDRARSDYGNKKQRLADLPISQYDERGKLEIAIRADAQLMETLPKALFEMSLDANDRLLESLKTLKPEQRVATKQDPKGVRPKLPGTYGGSYSDRVSQKAEEKIFLTPVDDQFYDTQLGRKVERDFGGRAEYWSYDYEKNELYVRIKGDTGRVRVIKDQGSVRTIQTRNGADFTNVYKDEAVDLFKAKGRFLTGSKDDDSLFGEMPKDRGPTLLPEKLPAAHSHDDGHKHDQKK